MESVDETTCSALSALLRSNLCLSASLPVWQTAYLADCLSGGLPVWLTDWLTVWRTDWLTVSRTDCLADCLPG